MKARIIMIFMATVFLGGANAALAAEQHPGAKPAVAAKHHNQKHKAHHNAKRHHAKHAANKGAGK